MDPFGGFDPQVGEIRAVRTFRIGEGGVLYPLFSSTAWLDGENVASCGMRGATAHTSPDPGCTCGFYAYAGSEAASEYAHATHVLAVVSCWGQVIAGTRGIRAQKARIEALWMSATVPSDLGVQVAQRYRSTAIYQDRAEMLVEHPPTALDCYHSPTRGQLWLRRTGLRAVVVAGIVLGVLSSDWILGSHDRLAGWIAMFLFFAVGTFVLGRRPDVAARRRSAFFGVMALWLLAPFGGWMFGVLLRLPLLQVGSTLTVQHMLIRQAPQFPTTNL